MARERCSVGIHVYGRRRVRTLLGVNKATLFGLLAASALVLGVGCADETKLTSSDLDTLCSAARAAANKVEGNKGTHLVTWVMDKGEPSAGLKRLIATDLVTSPDKGKAIAKWRERSELGDFSCASLESIYPGSTGQPL